MSFTARSEGGAAPVGAGSPVAGPHGRGGGAVADVVDYDLHGFVGVRLVDASREDREAVTRQLGPIESPLAREPDIIVRFVDRLAPSSQLSYLGLDEAAFSDDAFLVLRGKHKSQVKVQIPFERVGEACEIVCETGLPALPLLIPIVNLTALAKGIVPLHASAFSYEGTGVLVTGWAKGGKTESLLGFMAHGAQYVGDEWVYLHPDGSLFGIPEPIRIWDWHLPDLPRYRARVPRRVRARWRAINALNGIHARSTRVTRSRGSFHLADRIMAVVGRQLSVQIPPSELFGAESCVLSAPLDKVFLLVSGETAEVTVAAIDPQEIARRMVFSLEYERLDFLSWYLRFRFALPDAMDGIVERTRERQSELLTRALHGKDAYVVHQPFPAPIPALVEAIRPFVQGAA